MILSINFHFQTQNDLNASRDEAAREAKRTQLFQAEMELVQSVEQSLKKELATERELKTTLESERVALTSKLDAVIKDHQSYVERNESRLQETLVTFCLLWNSFSMSLLVNRNLFFGFI